MGQTMSSIAGVEGWGFLPPWGLPRSHGGSGSGHSFKGGSNALEGEDSARKCLQTAQGALRVDDLQFSVVLVEKVDQPNNDM